jgi:uncharacterized membrane protein YoaK (UPF0700 family)
LTTEVGTGQNRLIEEEESTLSEKVLIIFAAVSFGIGIAGSVFPVFKSRKLSPASIQRRFYWTGCASALTLLFLASLDRWPSNLFLIFICAAVAIAIAFFRTSHIKIDGRIYGAYSVLRQPDPPPALQERQKKY